MRWGALALALGWAELLALVGVVAPSVVLNAVVSRRPLPAVLLRALPPGAPAAWAR